MGLTDRRSNYKRHIPVRAQRHLRAVPLRRGYACTLEAFVGVNHHATFLCMTDFGLSGRDSYIPFTHDTEPNFIGEETTIGEYMEGWVEPVDPLPEVICPVQPDAPTHDSSEKPSVLEKIRAAQKAPKPPREPKSERNKKNRT